MMTANFYETERGQILLCDSIEWLKNPPDSLKNSVAAVITDPPYSLAIHSSMRQTHGDWVESENAAHFYASWFKGCYEILSPGGWLAVFCNYRSLPALFKAMMLSQFRIFAPVVWDKKMPEPGMVGFRNVCEFVAIGLKGKGQIRNRSLRNLCQYQWQSQHGKTGHPAEKPLPLLEWLVRAMTEPDDLVVDSFLGSGTTAVACESLGRRWLGIEMDEKWATVAKRRLEELGNTNGS